MDQEVKTSENVDELNELPDDNESYTEGLDDKAKEDYERLVKENRDVLKDEDFDPDSDIDDEEFSSEDNGDDREVLGGDQALIEGFRKQIADLIAENARQKEEMLRQAAEAVNGRKRAEAEVERVRKFALESFVKALLPVVDALDQAIAVTDRSNEAVIPTLEGVEGTMKLFLKELGSFGVERLDPEGEIFDPNFHQAIAMVPTDEVEPNHIVKVMQKGFLLNGRVVRPAMVMVSKALSNAPNEAVESDNESGKQINIEA